MDRGRSGREPLPLSCPHRLGPVTHVSSVSCRAWLRLAASLGMCSGLKWHSLSLRAEGKGQSLGKACRDYSPAVPQPPPGPMGEPPLGAKAWTRTWKKAQVQPVLWELLFGENTAQESARVITHWALTLRPALAQPLGAPHEQAGMPALCVASHWTPIASPTGKETDQPKDTQLEKSSDRFGFQSKSAWL